MPIKVQDPAFRKLYEKSFILQKYDDLQIPEVPKQPSIKNHVVTTFTLASIIHFIIYPFDTIKTRLISHNKVSDIAKFQLNKTKNQTAYLGLFRGYFSVLVGNSIYLTIGRQNIVYGAIVEGVLKTWIDMMKVSKQMANKEADLYIMRKSFGAGAFYAILRDLSYRGSFFFILQKMNANFLQGTRFDEGKKINNIFGSVILATLISQPFEVCFTKIASQRQLKYSNIWKVPLQIMKEQGFGKLGISGLWPRICYNLLSTSIMFNFYDNMLEATLEAI